MTSKTTTLIQEADGIARFPVFAPRDDMQNWLHLYDSAVLTALSVHFAELPNTVVASEVPVGPDLSNRDDIRIPDLLVAFDCDRELIEERRGYTLELMGRPPDFVLRGRLTYDGGDRLHGQASGLRSVRNTRVLALRSQRW